MSNEYRLVGVRLFESKGSDAVFHVVEPEISGLFQAVETFVELEDVVFGWVSRIVVSFWLFGVYDFVEVGD